MSALQELEPRLLWESFAGLNAVPRPSKHEEQAVAFVQAFAARHGLSCQQDAIGNLLIRKPASPGREDRPAVVLQTHLDMVHQKNAGCDFDFASQGIRMLVEGDWIRADGTTLGADNGVGVAAVMAVLASRELVHPPLEALFTVDEETGMTGAKGLQGGLLHGHTLLNLDSEDDRELTIGCAGGLDVVGTGTYSEEDVPAGCELWEIRLSGLTGGHSGMDIHRGRANANKLMNRLLYHVPVRICSIDGGGLRNAIPREATALVAISSDQRDVFRQAVADLGKVLQSEFSSTDPALQLSAEPVERPARVLAREFQDRLLRAVYALPDGVHRLSPEVAGLVQTSNNLARVLVQDGAFSLQCLCRGSLGSEKEDLATAVGASMELCGATVESSGEYPGWLPRPDSGVVQLMTQVYRDLFEGTPHVVACHAGLECGILGQNYPDMQMISFGPNIHGAHSPDERVQISSVQKFWRLLQETLARL